MIEAKVVEVKTDAEKRIGFKWQAGVQSTGLQEMEAIPVLSTKEFFAQNPNSCLYQDSFTDQRGEIFGLGDFYRESMLFKATFACLEKRNENKVLSNPKISAVNGQEASITVGTKVIYPGGADQPPKEKDTGIKLKITPRINDDGYITVDAEPEVSFVETWSNNGMYPVIGTRSAKTTVRVRDGEEILIGGLIRDEENKENNKIPLLGNIPIIKSLFSYKGKTGSSQELIILITPHIIAQSIESAAPSSLLPDTGMAPVGNYSAAAPVSTPQPAGTIDDSFDNAFDTSF